MNQKKILYLTLQQLLLLTYFLVTTITFLISINNGNQGLSIRLLGGEDDAQFYWDQAMNVLAGKEWIRSSIYSLLIGNFMKVTGVINVYSIRIINYLVFVVLVIFSLRLISLQRLYEVADNNIDIYDSKSILLISFLLYTSLYLNTSFSIIRDVWIYALYSFCMVTSIPLLFERKKKVSDFFFFFFAVISLWQFRPYSVASFIFSVFLYAILIYSIRKKKLKKMLFLTFLAGGIYYWGLKEFSIPLLGRSLTDILSYRSSGLGIYAGNSQMFISLDQKNFILFLFHYLYSYIGNFIGPLPWHIKGMSMLAAFFLESIPLSLILYSVWKKREAISKIQGYILVHALVWIGVISVFNDNLGTATRLRPLAWILIFNVWVNLFKKEKMQKIYEKL